MLLKNYARALKKKIKIYKISKNHKKHDFRTPSPDPMKHCLFEKPTEYSSKASHQKRAFLGQLAIWGPGPKKTQKNTKKKIKKIKYCIRVSYKKKYCNTKKIIKNTKKG